MKLQAEEIQIFIRVLLWGCGGIISVGAASAVVIKLFSPYKRLKAEVAELRALSEDNKKKLGNDLQRFESNDERDNLMMDALFTLVEHARTNNSTGLMEATSKKLQAYLIHRRV